MEYVLFVLITATLILRPAELVPALIGLPIYNYLILSCLIVSSPKIIETLQPQRLQRQPITIAVLAMIVAVAMSHFSRLDLWSTRTYTIAYVKTVIYFVLMISVVDRLNRLKYLMYWVAVFTLILSGLAVGQFQGYFEIEALEALQDWDYDPVTGERFRIMRLRGTGIFNDPNDLSMIVVTAMLICAMGLLDRSFGGLRTLWLIPLFALGYTLTLTQSRGGFLAMLLGGFSLFYSRYGPWKSMLLGALALPMVGVVFGGRQTDISGALSGGTGHSRVELWSQGLQLLRHYPAFGVGYRQYAEHAGQVAHNSFVHCFGELGFFGGSMFLGAFWLAFRILWRLGRQRKLMDTLTGNDQLSFVQPFLMAMLVGFMVSIMSLSRSYTLTTYLMLGFVATYHRIVQQDGVVSGVKPNPQELIRIVAASVAFIIFIYLYIRVGFR